MAKKTPKQKINTSPSGTMRSAKKARRMRARATARAHSRAAERMAATRRP